MQVNKHALERINQSNITGPHLAETFKLLAAHPGAQMAEGATVSFSLAYERSDDEIEAGDVFPVLTLSLKPPSELPDGKPDPASDCPDPGATQQ